MRHTESHLQQGCVREFRLTHPDLELLFFSIPNGACTSISQARILVGEGMTAGVADTMLAIPNEMYHGAFIEFKQERIEIKEGKEITKRGYQRKEQKAFQAAVEAQGYCYVIIRTIEEFRNFIKAYLSNVKS